uniref:40S ribosomal protein S12 n=1 Tax=Saccharomyces cerevisiae (strain ATCC 204508 / S288c) TaxID=559292 RepID=UPI00051FF432|nr:Chain C2, 40S ribosomal protein S12 [Saccharomyces cerevisiae S288C]4U3M_c2 Chain c2, 40S ribosomal protein S12 [Saccharomyces cerevisiae S288C]4U3N_C2 Chain C2, 40S ribosomal protein S12 [Saccharomyces cerevisiae S288C]4U3N_c2 Chain c2, 40S ribosomal protein S12 [Saccharomyces cerevisiae S288C]4U3U_C2 Chain C2, 40S ribosomal protein S12 [Saccharomyces cerevisiae S288C]4U3U_c2 Chain c2, 40S ribosomal protein S12 [Saccharomyces cerevisiae S288C]4U4N_C2 Chain C2, 40S ribosomal protein S12 [S
SDVEEVVEVQEETVVEQTAEVTIEDALKVVLRTALVHDGLARGLRESTKALTRGEALLVVLVSSVTEANIIKLVEGLANDPENKVPLIKVADAKQLGEWAGLAKIDREANARKVVGASVVVVKNWGAETDELSMIMEHFSQQ